MGRMWLAVVCAAVVWLVAEPAPVEASRSLSKNSHASFLDAMAPRFQGAFLGPAYCQTGDALRERIDDLRVKIQDLQAEANRKHPANLGISMIVLGTVISGAALLTMAVGGLYTLFGGIVTCILGRCAAISLFSPIVWGGLASAFAVGWIPLAIGIAMVLARNRKPGYQEYRRKINELRREYNDLRRSLRGGYHTRGRMALPSVAPQPVFSRSF